MGVLMAIYCEEKKHALGKGVFNVAQSLHKSLIFNYEAGFVHIMVELSHPQLKSLLSSGEVCLTKLEDILARIKSCSNDFQSLDFHSISLSYNKVAKSLANYAKEITTPSIWIEEGTEILLPIVFAELSW